MERRGTGTGANFIRTDDGSELFYRDWGSGRPVLFLAGWALPSDMWSYQMAPLSARGLRCVAYDRRGHGRSSDPGRGYDYDRLAGDLAAVIDALGLDEVTVVAHSMASGEAVRYLTRQGSGRVARLVLLAPASTPFLLKTADNPGGIDGAVFEQLRETMLLADFPAWLEANARPFVMPDTSRSMIDWLEGMMLGCSLQAAVACNLAMTTTDFRGELGGIDVPTLVIHGGRDASAPLELTGQPTAAMIPAAELRVYDDAPHGLFVTHRARLNADLLGFAQG
jgi:pimeloyl-ACP methyl ester carboxylesterase